MAMTVPTPAGAHRVAVLVLEGAMPLDVGIPAQVFRARPHLPYVSVVCGVRPGVVAGEGGVTYALDAGLEALETAGTVVVPGYADPARAPDPRVSAALREAYERGSRVVSICSGAFSLAAAGLLDGRRATTHWADADALARRYPAVRVDPDVLFVDEGRVLTSAGVAAGIDLCLHLVRRDLGVAVANDLARAIVAAPYRSGGQAQYVGRTAPEPTQERLAGTRAWALERLAEPLTVADLAAHASCSVRTFTRRFLAETGHPPVRWLLRARVDAARELLERTDRGVDRIATDTGLGTAANLRLHFRRVLHTSPSEYRRTFATLA